MSTFLRVIIYETFSFLEKEKIHSAGPKIHSVLTLLSNLMTKAKIKGVNIHIVWQQK